MLVYIEKEKLNQLIEDQMRLWSIALPIIEQAEKESPIPGFEVVHKPLESLSEFLKYLEESNAE